MIQINDKVRITRLDKYCLQVEEHRKVINPKTKEEKDKWCWVGYYGDLKSAIIGIVKHSSKMLVDEEIKGCETIIKRLDSIEDEIRNAIMGDITNAT